MKYLLIVLVIAFLISPLLWMRQTPGQARITAFRNRALQLGLRVQVVPPADAAPDDRSPDAVRYIRPLLADELGNIPQFTGYWTLLRSRRRGHVSPFEGWRWHRGDAPVNCHEAIARCLAALPETVVALRADDQGLSAYWSETGTVQQVDAIATAINELFPTLLAPIRAIPPAPRPLAQPGDPHL